MISRRDRHEGENRGGVLTLCRDDVKNIVFLSHSACAERSWHLIQRDSGSILIVNWYRPPSEDGTSIDGLNSEMQAHAHQTDELVICGDLNIHHRRWLRFSSGNTTLGERMQKTT